MRPMTGDDPAPAPSPASHCSWGGSRVLAADDEGRQNEDNDEWGTGCEDQRDDMEMRKQK
jgi:hypothetical protein